MFDMGFDPQIKMILQNIRPDRQTVLFSATFPKTIEKLAKTMLILPLEIIIGERSTVNKDITQIVEIHEEEDKYLRLLQLLGMLCFFMLCYVLLCYVLFVLLFMICMDWIELNCISFMCAIICCDLFECFTLH